MNAKATALTFLGLGLALAGCASFEDELPESCIVIEEVKTTPPDKVVIDTKMEVRNYPIVCTFLERMSSASEDIKSFGASTVKSEVIAKESDEDRELKEFFARCCGATWPVGSSCTYVKAISKLRVRNTPENLKLIDEFIDELNAGGVLVEIQARFVRTSLSSTPFPQASWSAALPRGAILSGTRSAGLRRVQARRPFSRTWRNTSIRQTTTSR